MTKRIEKWDTIKGRLITLVVIGHLLLYIQNNVNAERLLLIIYSFHMPLFVFISGLMSKRAIDRSDYSKTVYFIGLFATTKALLVLSNLAIGTVPFKLIDINDVSWYAFALATFYAISIFFKVYKSVRFLFWVSILASCLIGYNANISTVLSASRLFTFYPFFVAGYITNVKDLRKLSSSKALKLLAVVVIVSLVTTVYFKTTELWPYLGLLQGKYPYEQLGIDPIWSGGCYRLCWYIISFVLIVAVITLTFESRISAYIGRNTLPVYVLHMPIINILMKTGFKKIICGNLVSLITMGILLTCVLSTTTLAVRKSRNLWTIE